MKGPGGGRWAVAQAVGAAAHAPGVGKVGLLVLRSEEQRSKCLLDRALDEGELAPVCSVTLIVNGDHQHLILVAGQHSPVSYLLKACSREEAGGREGGYA